MIRSARRARTRAQPRVRGQLERTLTPSGRAGCETAMSWYSKVVWSEGLFLRPHHLQQSDRYLERQIEGRVGQVTPYPWGFVSLEIDRDLAQQGKFGLRRASGILPDGTPFSIPDISPLPSSIAVPENAA